MIFQIIYHAKYSTGGMEPLPVCSFEGDLKTVKELVGNLNCHRDYDEIKNNKDVWGYFSYRELPVLAGIGSESAIRDLADQACKEHFR